MPKSGLYRAVKNVQRRCTTDNIRELADYDIACRCHLHHGVRSCKERWKKEEARKTLDEDRPTTTVLISTCLPI